MTRRRPLRVVGSFFCAIGILGLQPPASGLQRSAAPRGGLETLFAPGTLLQDRNQDGVIDWVDANIVLGDSPSAGDVAAAADVAARLGYETMAMNLPLSSIAAGARTEILIGTKALSKASVSATETGVAELGAGEGLVTLLSSEERQRIVVAGADEAGTRAAAELFAGRLPHLWEPKGTTLSEVVKDLSDFLASNDVELGSVRVRSARVKAGADALEQLAVQAELGSPTRLARARTALRGLARSRPSASATERAPLSYPGVKVLRVQLVASGSSPTHLDLPQVTPAPKGGPIPARPGSAAKDNLDLSTLYSAEGLLGDSDENVIPDRVDAILSPTGAGLEAAIDLAARMGLESTGISIPIARLPEAIDKPEEQPTLVLIGEKHPLIDQLAQDGKLAPPPLEPGQGLIQVVPKAFGEKGAVVITGGDERGLDRAVQQVAERFPHVWERGKDRTTLDDVEVELWRFFSGRSPAGQAATALYKLDRIVRDLSKKELASARVVVSVEKPAPGFKELIEHRAASLGAESLEVTLDNRDVQNASLIFEDEFEVASEVEEFWKVFRAAVLPKVKKRQAVVLEARLSEPPEIRSQIEKAARAELLARGAADAGTRVTVLSAYKQGYEWLHDVVRPALSGKSVDRLLIRFAKSTPPPEWRQQAMHTPVRWLKEIFPIDEVLARELGVDLERIRFEMAPPESPIYEVIARAADGSELLRQSFEPKFVLRPYFDRFRDYEMVRVTTGRISATVAGKSVVDQRIATEAERFWDRYQEKTLSALYDYIMARHEGNPRGGGRDAPYFGELRVELTLSEPNYLIGIDKELISSMDALHEDIYFGTLMFFRVLGRYARGQELTYPGRIIPLMHPRADGKPGRAKITFTGFATSRPAVVVEYQERNGQKGISRLDVSKVTMDRPRALAALVRDGRPGLERLDVRVKADTEKDERDDLVKRERKEEVDERILSAEQVQAMIANLGEMRAAGLYREALAYRDLGGLRIAAGWEHEVSPKTEVVAALAPNGSPAPAPDIRKLLPPAYRYDGGPLVQWDTPIPPPEAYEILARMSTFPEASVYKVGESYLGKDSWAVDLMPPLAASHWSHAKATTLKPTVVYSARQHANEVSSTSHVLKLAELILTQPEYRKKLDKANVVIHPVTNPDGAQLAYDLYRTTPEFILHAGYLGSLGMDATSGSREDLPIYPESKVRPKLWSTWLPDIFLNPHGYPSHQVVQLFSEFDGLVRGGRVTERNWSMNKGWFIPGFDYLDDPKFPRHKEAAFEIRDYITRNLNAAPDVYAMNQRNYARYRRYGVEFDPDVYQMDMTDDVLIYMPLKGARARRSREEQGDPDDAFNPKVTIWSGSTEAPDETAHGDWMKLVATAGLQWDKAILDYLVDGNHRVERKGSAFWGGVSLSLDRPRPPKPDKSEEKTPTSPGEHPAARP